MVPFSSVLYLSVLFLTVARGQYPQSPCPDYFEYRGDETGVYGVITVRPTERSVSSIIIRINFTVGTKLTSNYVGKVVAQGENLALIQRYNRGLPIQYRVEFPVISPLPRLTSLFVNDEQVCYGPGDAVYPGTTVTRIALQHTLYLRSGSNDFFDQVDQNPSITQPSINFYQVGSGSNLPAINFDNDRTKVWGSIFSDMYPYSNINNPTQGFESFESRPATPSFDLTKLYPKQTQQIPITNYPPAPATTTIPTTLLPKTVATTTTTPAPRPVDFSECGMSSTIDKVPLVYNGMSYTRGDWPWLVAIFRRKDIGLSYVCSGTLISDRHVITAAHCMHRKSSITSKRDIVVKVGVHNILDWGDDDITVTRNLALATIHESYNASTLANDILLLTFVRPVEFNAYVKAACLWSGNVDLVQIVGATGVVTGWGVSEIGPAGQGEPRMVRMPVVSTATCRASKPDFHKLTSSRTLCAGDRNGAGPCLGDSGGGLYLLDHGRWKLRGIVSLSLPSSDGELSCNLEDYIVFTDTAQYLNWIEKGMSAKVDLPS